MACPVSFQIDQLYAEEQRAEAVDQLKSNLRHHYRTLILAGATVTVDHCHYSFDDVLSDAALTDGFDESVMSIMSADEYGLQKFKIIIERHLDKLIERLVELMLEDYDAE